MTMYIGQTVGHYDILERIGEGGMGVVYKARDSKLNRPVALKFLPSNLIQDKDTRKRFRIEAQAASKLDHPNICTIHEINETPDGQLYICMAYYPGASLNQKIRQGPIPFDEAINIFVQIAQGLMRAHEENIIHRDIKPGNIIVTERGEVKIVDFGLAKLAGIDLTRSTSSKGTAAYMSPEQIRGGTADQRSDIWALGVVLYEMLTGHRPFRGDYPEPVMFSIVNEEPLPLSHHLDDVPEKLQTIMNKVLQKDPAGRYQSVAALLSDLQPLVKSDELAQLKTRSDTIKGFKHKKSSLYAAMAGILCVLFILFAKIYFFPPEKEANKIIVIPMDNKGGEAEQEYFLDGMTDELIAHLARVGGLNIISRSTAMKYKGTTKTPPEIAAELNIDYIIDFSVSKSGDKVRISTGLINASDDIIRWAETYELDMKNLPTLLNDIAKVIAKELNVEVTKEELERFSDSRPVNPETYELYLKGNYHLNIGGLTEAGKATEYFKKAIAIDSTLALAYVGLGYGYAFETWFGIVPYQEGLQKINGTIEKALALDANLAEAYYLLGAFRLWQLWDWQGSGEAFNRGRSLNPNVKGLYHAEYLYYLLVVGKFDEAVSEGKRLLELDPLSAVMRRALGQIYYLSRQYDKGIELYQRTLELEPEDERFYNELADMYEKLGNNDNAYQNRIKAIKLSGVAAEEIAVYDSLYNVLGPKAYATWRLNREKKSFDKYPTTAALIYADLGEHTKALAWLERAYEKRDGPMATLNVNPDWDPLRGEPRFQALLQKMNFPE